VYSWKEDVEARESGHGYEDTGLFIMQSRIGVAENGAVWITDKELPLRVLPFITQHLAVIINREAIVDTMHHAYEQINNEEYGYGCFIAGPSKTADIEQSLVLGAHGPLSMTVFLLNKSKEANQ
jgi:L-lactate dehydrogenase complex protein LldG